MKRSVEDCTKEWQEFIGAKVDGKFGEESLRLSYAAAGGDLISETTEYPAEYPPDDYKLTPEGNFLLHETYSDYPEHQKPPIELIPNLMKTARAAEIVRKAWNDYAVLKGQTDEVKMANKSWYRSQAENDNIYRKQNKPSEHIIGAGLDPYAIGLSHVDAGIVMIRAYAKSTFNGLGLGKGNFHLGIRGEENTDTTIIYESLDGAWPFQNKRALWHYYSSKYDMPIEWINELKELNLWDSLKVRY